jgi:hypothetical protein
MSHTPGPWTASLDDTPYFVYSAIDTDPDICDLLPRDADVYTEEDEANACLIAAAPELLDACWRVIRLLQQREGQDALIDATLHQVRAAIAKAEGRP